MYYHDLSKEIQYLKSRLLYKTKRLDEAVASSQSEESIDNIRLQIRELEEKIALCSEELKSQDDAEGEEWRRSFE